MSANNQTLVLEHKGKWLIFKNVNAESCGEDTLKASEAVVVCRDKDMAYDIAELVDIDENLGSTEYGVSSHLVKDGTEVKII